MCELLVFQVHEAGKQGVEKKVCKFEAVRPRICNLFKTLLLLERTGEKKVTNTWKNFKHDTNLDNYGNRVFF